MFKVCPSFLCFQHRCGYVLVSLIHRVGGVMVSIGAFQALDPGSIPGRRNFFYLFLKKGTRYTSSCTLHSLYLTTDLSTVRRQLNVVNSHTFNSIYTKNIVHFHTFLPFFVPAIKTLYS